MPLSYITGPFCINFKSACSLLVFNLDLNEFVSCCGRIHIFEVLPSLKAVKLGCHSIVDTGFGLEMKS